MRIWSDLAYRPYTASNSSNSGLLLDDFLSDKFEELQKVLKDEESDLSLIPPNYTGLFQLCVFGTNKFLMERLSKKANKWHW